MNIASINNSLSIQNAGDAKTNSLLTRLQSETKNINQAKVDKVSKEFEAVFVSEMMNHMFEGVQVDENFGGGFAEEMWTGVLREEVGKVISRRNNLGISEAVARDLLKLQEVGLQEANR